MRQDQEEFNIPEDPTGADDCPVNELLGKRVSQMNDDELQQYVSELRASVESPQTLRKLLVRKGARKEKGPKKVNLSALNL